MKQIAIAAAIYGGCLLAMALVYLVIPWVLAVALLPIALTVWLPWPTLPAVLLALGQIAVYQRTRP